MSTSGSARSSIVASFGNLTFNEEVQRQRLPKDAFQALRQVIERGEKLQPRVAAVVAHAMKEWALENGATHYCHWFQPMTGSTAEKHDAFLSFDSDGQVVERFSGSQLIQSEPDASSFPSGGMRSTFEARGYTAWDPSTPAFLMEGPGGVTLCIPSAFLGYHGEALDEKTPLHRSLDALSTAATRVLHLLGEKHITRVTTQLGSEQEYFLVDRTLFLQRPDLTITGRTLLGALPAKGQQLEDHYFGAIPERVQGFMREVEQELYRLGVPAKTRHNEVAPHQFELAPIHEETNVAADHNLLVMEILRKVAARRGLALLIHEKPFAGINGSGKHNNWSMTDSTGQNLLDPGTTPHQNLKFLTFLVAVLKGVHTRSALLRAAIASAGNDHRLGANEAPPAIMSVFLGEQLDGVLNAIERGEGSDASSAQHLSLGVNHLPDISQDNTDRNRTSPFAFTGNKFEFRAVPSSMNVAIPNTILNTAIAEALDSIADQIQVGLGAGKPLDTVLTDVIHREVVATKAIRFEGDGYSQEWQQEAARRGLPNLRTTPEALASLKDPSVRELFSRYKVLGPQELEARYHIRLEQYIKQLEIEGKVLANMVRSRVLPAAFTYQQRLLAATSGLEGLGLAREIVETQRNPLRALAALIAQLVKAVVVLEDTVARIHQVDGLEAQAQFCCDRVMGAMKSLRDVSDKLENHLDRSLWPFPSYQDLLFGL